MNVNSNPLRLVALSAGVGMPSSTRMLTDLLTTATRTALEAAGRTVEVATVELRDLAHQVVDMTLTHFPDTELGEVLDQLTQADGVIAVSPTFNTSYSGLFKSFFDILEAGTVDATPMLLGATGGTARHSLAVDYAMRPMMAYLRADVLPTSVFAASEDFGGVGEAPDTVPLGQRATRAGQELAERILARAGDAPVAVNGAAGDDSERLNTSTETRPTRPGPGVGPEQAMPSGTEHRPVRAEEADPVEQRPAARMDRPSQGRRIVDEFADFTPMEQLLAR